MEVLVGPTFSIDVSSSAEYVRDRNEVPLPPEEDGAASSCSSPKEEEKDGVVKIGSGVGFGGGRGEAPDDDDDEESDASSSIGVPDDDSDGDDDGDVVSPKNDGVDEEVQSKSNRGLASLGSLEDSLPIKRGLSNHFSGKSKSFANLTEACSTKDLEKPENPFNKRRRVLIQAKLLRKSSFYAWRNPKSMPLLALNEDEEDEAPSSPRANPEEDDDDDDEEVEERVPKWRQQRRVKNMKSFSCFSLSDMENHHHLQQLQE